MKPVLKLSLLLTFMISIHAVAHAQSLEQFKDQRMDETAIRITADKAIHLIAAKDYSGLGSILDSNMLMSARPGLVKQMVDLGAPVLASRGIPPAEQAHLMYSVNVIRGDSLLIHSIVYQADADPAVIDAKPVFFVFNFARVTGTDKLVGYHMGSKMKP